MTWHVAYLANSSIEEVKEQIRNVNEEYDGLDVLCSERWGAWDLEGWAQELDDIKCEIIYPTYARQLSAFTEYYVIVKTGRFKSPICHIEGSKGSDIVDEELSMFNHDLDGKKFGSPEKKSRYGVQDDSVYSNAWMIYGGRMLTSDDFRQRSGKAFFGMFQEQQGLVGDYN